VSGPPPARGEATSELCRRVSAAVRRACPGWLASQSEDIAQSVLAQLVKSGLAGEGVRPLSTTYLQKAAYGATVDEIRRRCRRKENPVSDPRVMEHAPDPLADPERRTRSSETGAAIRLCLKRLVPPRKLAVTLYLQGCGVPETARRMGWDTKRAENLVYRGLADVRRCLDARGFHP
jgi:RNA polymerase sigma-70 factor (ECF subfamily)